MVVVSNFEKIEDQDQGYDESDCVDLFCCAVVSISLDNKRIRLSVDWDKPVKYNNTNSEFGLGIPNAPSNTPNLKNVGLLIIDHG